MSTTTLSHAKNILEVFDRMDLANDQVVALLKSGLLEDLVCATKTFDLLAVDPEAYQKALGIEPYVFRTRLGGSENTDQIVARLRFPIENSFWVNQINFPIAPRDGQKDVDIELIEPGHSFTREKGLNIIDSAKLLRPTHEHAIRFAEQHGENPSLQRKQFIVFLQSPQADESIFRHLYLRRTAQQTELCMHTLDHTYSAEYILAGIRPR